MPIVASDHNPIDFDNTILTGHTTVVRGLKFSASGNHLVSVSSDTLCLWDTKSGAMILSQAEAFSHNADFSGDESRLAIRDDHGNVHVWRTSDGTPIRPRFTTAKQRSSLPFAYSPNKPLVVIRFPVYRSYDYLHLWHTETGKSIAQPMRPQGEIHCVSFSHNGDRIICAGDYKREKFHSAVCIWNVATLEMGSHPSGTLNPHFNSYFYEHGYSVCIALSPDGRSVVSGTDQGRLIMWDTLDADNVKGMDDGQAFDPIHHNYRTRGSDYEIEQIIFSPDGTHIASGGHDGTLLLWTQKGDLLSSLKGHTRAIRAISFSPKGDRLLSISRDQTVKVWDTCTGTELSTVFTGYTGRCSAVAVSSDWTYLALANYDLGIRLIELKNSVQGDTNPTPDPDKPFAEMPLAYYSGQVDQFAFSWDGGKLVTSRGFMKIWHLPTQQGMQATFITLPVRRTSSWALSPVADYMVLGKGSALTIWNLDTGEKQEPDIEFTEPGSYVRVVACSRTHTIAAGFSEKELVRLWDALTDNFVGRSDLIKAILAYHISPLPSGTAGHWKTVLHGIGGIGKTQLSVKIAQELQSR